MRNLKRVLSLALASAMLLGMMVIGAGAADTTKKPLTDLDKVTNKEAVNLMVDLGIIAGKPDGSFAPAETVDRATMSKLIYFIMMGTADESAFKGINTGLKDVAGNWAEGFINYCYSVKIVAGTGDNTYNPNGKVTTAAAAKMLLVALGYDAEASKYQNDPMWSVNIMRDAQSAGLLANMTQASSEELTRDNAAQMIYNALFANTVKPDFEIDMGVKYLKGYSPVKESDGTTIVTLAKSNYNLKKYTGVVVANEFADIFGDNVQDAGKSLIYTYNEDGAVVATDAKTVKVSTDVSMLGQEAVFYTHGKDNTQSSFITATGKTKEYTWTDDKIGYDKFLSNNSLTGTGMKKSLNYESGSDFVIKANEGVRFVDSNADGKLDFALKTAYNFSKVTKVDSTNITITGLGTRKLADVSGSADLKKDDYVNFANVGTSGKATAEKAVEVAGTVGALKDSSKKIVVDGTTYTVAADSATIKVNPASPAVLVKEYVKDLNLSKAVAGIFYLNKSGEAVVYLPTEDGSSTSSLYAYVTALNKTKSFSTITIEAKVVLADGTEELVMIVDDSSKNTDGLYDQAKKDVDLDTLVGVYPYTLNSDGEMLAGKKVDDTAKTAGDYTSGKPTMALEGNKNVLLDNSTIVLFYDKKTDPDNVKISSYTGVNNVPGIKTGMQVTHVTLKDKTFATFVLVEAAVETATADYAYALGNGYASQTSKGYEYNMVINGEKTTLTTKNPVEGMRIGNIYTYGEDSNEVATMSLVATSTIKTGTIKSVADKYVVIGDESVELASDYSVDDLTATDKDGAIVPAPGDLTADSQIVYVASATGKLVKAYIVNTGKAEGVDGSNKGARIIVDGYDVTLTGTLSASNTLEFKFSAPAGISMDDTASVSDNLTTKSGAIAEGKTSVTGTMEYAGDNAEIEVTIKWNANYTETYTFNTKDLNEFTPPPVEG